ncbi:MAG: hypothetical protein IK080_06335 [Clostridia bacterium]|nr:hypothetical protein [Clostridia bacterium]
MLTHPDYQSGIAVSAFPFAGCPAKTPFPYIPCGQTPDSPEPLLNHEEIGLIAVGVLKQDAKSFFLIPLACLPQGAAHRQTVGLDGRIAVCIFCSKRVFLQAGVEPAVA